MFLEFYREIRSEFVSEFFRCSLSFQTYRRIISIKSHIYSYSQSWPALHAQQEMQTSPTKSISSPLPSFPPLIFDYGYRNRCKARSYAAIPLQSLVHPQARLLRHYRMWLSLHWWNNYWDSEFDSPVLSIVPSSAHHFPVRPCRANGHPKTKKWSIYSRSFSWGSLERLSCEDPFIDRYVLL